MTIATGQTISEFSEINQRITTLQSHKDEWALLPLSEKIRLLLAVRTNLKSHAQEWITLVRKVKI